MNKVLFSLVWCFCLHAHTTQSKPTKNNRWCKNILSAIFTIEDHSFWPIVGGAIFLRWVAAEKTS